MKETKKQSISPTTLGSILGGLGTALSAAGYFWPPAFLIGGGISALAKVLTGVATADAKDVPVAPPSAIYSPRP